MAFLVASDILQLSPGLIHSSSDISIGIKVAGIDYRVKAFGDNLLVPLLETEKMFNSSLPLFVLR